MLKKFSSTFSTLKMSGQLFLAFCEMLIQFFVAIKLLFLHIKTFRELSPLNCPLEVMKEGYMFLEKNHLEILPHNGLFIQNTHRINDVFPNIVALDNSKTSLVNLSLTLEGCLCPLKTIHQDILSYEHLDSTFESISANFVIDRIQGGDTKIDEFIATMRSLLVEGGVLFGITVVGIGIQHKKSAMKYLQKQNSKGIWFNMNTSLATIETILKKHFDTIGLFNVGSCIFFRGILKKNKKDLSKYRPTLEKLKGKHIKINPEDFHKWIR